MNANPHLTPPLAKVAISAPALSTRVTRLGIGVFVSLFPLAAWGLINLVFGSNLIEKNSWRLHLDPVQIRIWLLIAAGLLELIAVFLLRKTDQKPRDWISIISLIDVGLSIFLAVFFWAQISLLIFGAT